MKQFFLILFAAFGTLASSGCRSATQQAADVPFTGPATTRESFVEPVASAPQESVPGRYRPSVFQTTSPAGFYQSTGRTSYPVGRSRPRSGST